MNFYWSGFFILSMIYNVCFEIYIVHRPSDRVWGENNILRDFGGKLCGNELKVICARFHNVSLGLIDARLKCRSFF